MGSLSISTLGAYPPFLIFGKGWLSNCVPRWDLFFTWEHSRSQVIEKLPQIEATFDKVM